MIKVNWRDRILEKFPPHAASITLVADPDTLLTEEKITQEIQARGFETLLYEDSISFRFIYESRYRLLRQNGSLSDLIIVLRCQPNELDNLPYDLLQESDRKLSFRLSELFPELSYSILGMLDRNLLDPLYEAILEHKPAQLGDTNTQDFILRHVFRIAPESIKEDSDLLHCLLRLHYREQNLPKMVGDRLVKILRQKHQFQHFPLELIVSNRSAFLKFLQDNWNNFARHQLFTQLPTVSTAESSSTYGEFGIANLPFEHKDVWAYMDNLFREGYLKPFNPQQLGIFDFNLRLDNLLRIGFHLDPVADKNYRFKKLLERLQETLPQTNAPYREWLSIAYRWAEVLVLQQQIDHVKEPDLFLEFHDLQLRLDTTFLDWVVERYHTLHYQSPANPVMLHHVPFFLARHLNPRDKQKVALVLMDGLALDQWLIIRNELSEQKPQWQFDESALFALLPTITSISRQAVFSGKTPVGFPDSIQVTSKEPALWRQFWTDQGFKPQQIGYESGLRDQQHLAKIEELASHPAIRILGLVVDKVDRISHGKESGTPNMHEQIRPWLKQGFLTNVLDILFGQNFQVFITADHGNIEAKGIGRPSEGAAAEYRGERVRIYPELTLRAKVKESYPSAIEWNSPILPFNFLPLLAPNRSAFVKTGEQIVAHGGISMEELVVPFIQIKP